MELLNIHTESDNEKVLITSLLNSWQLENHHIKDLRKNTLLDS